MGIFVCSAFCIDCVVESFAVFISLKTILMSAIEHASGKRNVRIDFAPMCDLGFLLVTFFVFTTSLLQPKAFGLHLPDKSGNVTSPLSSTITLTMKENGVVDYFEGSETTVLAKGTAYLYGKPSLREYLLDKRKRIITQVGNDEQYTVIIHPTAQSNYKEVVDVLDEMTITGIKKYVLLEDKPKY
jgi:biopolymer transport protein ExbD